MQVFSAPRADHPCFGIGIAKVQRIDMANHSEGVATMCSGDDHNCPEFELQRKKLLDDLDHERRSFLKSAVVAGGGAAAWAASGSKL